MYAADFDYYVADSVTEAVQLLERHPGASLLAGGHSLIPLLKLRLGRPPAVIDIGRIGALRGFRRQGPDIRVGCLTTHADLAGSPTMQDFCPLLSEVTGLIGDPQVRNRGTIGGSVAHAEPAADLPAALTALGASFRATGPRGQRTIAVSDFFQGVFETSLESNEILTDVVVPVRQEGQGMAYAKFPHPASRYAVIGAAVMLSAENGRCQSASVALGGLVSRPIRASRVEEALVGNPLSDGAIAEAAALAVEDLGDEELLGDIFASAEYRRAMAPSYVREALMRASQLAG
jgi:carbon-monoxide dehydrogenase medium subunit